MHFTHITSQVLLINVVLYFQKTYPILGVMVLGAFNVTFGVSGRVALAPLYQARYPFRMGCFTLFIQFIS